MKASSPNGAPPIRRRGADGRQPDPHHTQIGWITLPLKALGLDTEKSYQGTSPERCAPYGTARNYVEINHSRRPPRSSGSGADCSEHDFEYFLDPHRAKRRKLRPTS
jgi:hypothetical protein